MASLKVRFYKRTSQINQVFHGLTAMASLKVHYQIIYRRLPHVFHGLTAMASLKRRQGHVQGTSAHGIPWLNRHGLIEAICLMLSEHSGKWYSMA